VLAAKLLPRHSLAAKNTREAKIFAQTQPKVNYSDQLLNLTPKEE
jgi:phage antirepressor YoqD-like protein